MDLVSGSTTSLSVLACEYVVCESERQEARGGGLMPVRPLWTVASSIAVVAGSVILLPTSGLGAIVSADSCSDLLPADLPPTRLGERRKTSIFLST